MRLTAILTLVDDVTLQSLGLFPPILVPLNLCTWTDISGSHLEVYFTR
jgi:hypothetical protein